MEKVYGVDKFVEDLHVPCVGWEIAWYFFIVGFWTYSFQNFIL